MIGYGSYGPIPCTAASYDVYWLAVHPDFQRKGIGRLLLHRIESRIRESGGERIYVDTSQRLQYASTRAFYESLGYSLESILPDFYAPGDGKAVYCKVLPAAHPR
jgi:ribosomal protein S18 acetylase RimI-like enzyme